MGQYMSGVQWAIFCVFFLIYILLGGMIFVLMERSNETIRMKNLHDLRQDVIQVLLRIDLPYYRNDTRPAVFQQIHLAKMEVLHRMSDACGTIDFTDVNAPYDYKWNYYNAVFFAFTIVTTIGYGKISPTDDWGRLFVIIFGTVGIPLNGILLNGLGNFFGSKLINAHKKSKEKPEENKFTLALSIIFYLIPCLVLFMVLPSLIFSYMESWSLFDSIYYAFTTLTTIGFGDFIAGNGDGSTVTQWVYQSFIMIWILIGLAYIMMVLGFIAKGLMHKKLRTVVENQLHSINFTKEKLSKDVASMRKLVNELYLIRMRNMAEAVAVAASAAAVTHGENEENAYKPWEKYQDFQAIKESGGGGGAFNPTFVPEILLHAPKLDYSKQAEEPNRKISDVEKTISKDEPSWTNHQENSGGSNSGLIPDELLATVVDVLSQDIMTNLFQAVDELNEFQSFDRIEYPASVASGSTLSKQGAESNYPASSSHWLQRETDQDVLINGSVDNHHNGVDNNLEEVIIGNVVLSKPLPEKLMDKVHSVVRKISVSTCSDGPSRKVSREELGNNDRRKISARKSSQASNRSSLPSREVGSPQLPRPQRPSASSMHPNPDENEDSRIWGGGHHENFQLVNGHNNVSQWRQISDELEYAHCDTPSGNNLTKVVESTSLVSLLQSLDKVYDKLNPVKNLKSPLPIEASSSAPAQPSSAAAVIAVPPVGKRATVAGNPNLVLASPVTRAHTHAYARRRKVGIVHNQDQFYFGQSRTLANLGEDDGLEDNEGKSDICTNL